MWLGIDFGTSNSCAAVVMNDSIRLVLDPVSKNHVFPSSIYLEPTSGQMLVGQLAENRQFADTRYYQRAFKLQLGQKEPFMLGEHKKSAVQLVTAVIQKLKAEAESQIAHGPLSSAVITVPARYERPLCELMRSAAQAAGFQRIELLAEPVAAAVYYASQEKNKVRDGETFLIYDLGGGTFDATLVRRKGLRYELLGAPDGRQIGGEEFDDCIYHDLLSKVSSQLRDRLLQPQHRADRLRIRAICREIKHTLSISTEVRKSVVIAGEVIEYQLSRQRFISMIEDRIDETITCCQAILKRAGISGKDVRCVLLVGGSCRMPYIRERLKQRLSINVFPIDEPELAVSMGAAFYGDALDRATDFVKQVDALCNSTQFRDVLRQHLPELFQKLAQPLARGIAQEAVRPSLTSWQHGWTKRLNDIQPLLERSTKQWISSTACQEEIRKISLAWVQQRIPEVTRLSDPICDRYRVSRDILRLPTSIPQLEAGLPGTPVSGDGMVDSNMVSNWVTMIVVVVMGIIVVHMHILAALAGPVGIVAAAAAFYFGRGKTEEWIREADLPIWVRKLVLSDEKLNTQVDKVQSTLQTSLTAELAKSSANFDQFVAEIQRILKATMHEQAVREARFIWLHTTDEQARVA